MTKRAYQIPTDVDASSLPFVFEGERVLMVDGDYVEVDGSIVGYSEIPLRESGVPVPESVTARQMLLALHQENLLTAVETAVAGMDVVTQISWNKSSMFYRNNPLVATVAQALGKSAAELDAIFILAASL